MCKFKAKNNVTRVVFTRQHDTHSSWGIQIQGNLCNLYPTFLRVCSVHWGVMQQKVADYKQTSTTLHIHHASTRLNIVAGNRKKLLSWGGMRAWNLSNHWGKVTKFGSLRQQRTSGLSPWVQGPSESAKRTCLSEIRLWNNRYNFSDCGYRV